VCSDGVTMCDRFIALYNACDMIARQDEIDVFQIACHVKQAQPHFFKHIVSYSLSINSISRS